MAIHPTMATAHNALGIAAEASGDFERARSHYLETLRLSPQFAGTQGHLARLENAGDRRIESR